jgi:hypothetical protein
VCDTWCTMRMLMRRAPTSPGPWGWEQLFHRANVRAASAGVRSEVCAGWSVGPSRGRVGVVCVVCPFRYWEFSACGRFRLRPFSAVREPQPTAWLVELDAGRLQRVWSLARAWSSSDRLFAFRPVAAEAGPGEPDTRPATISTRAHDQLRKPHNSTSPPPGGGRRDGPMTTGAYKRCVCDPRPRR